LNFAGDAMHHTIAQRVIILCEAFTWEIMGVEQIWTK
jgi:hypothetical protein